ncbi:MAG: hypothetical protein ACH0QD_04570 [Tepidibacillus sp.]
MKVQYKLQWINTIREKIGSTYPTYEAANFLITFFFPDRTTRDLDNIEFKYIIDAFRYIGIIPNDDWTRVSITLEGEYDPDNPRTEIKVLPRNRKEYKYKIKYKLANDIKENESPQW